MSSVSSLKKQARGILAECLPSAMLAALVTSLVTFTLIGLVESFSFLSSVSAAAIAGNLTAALAGSVLMTLLETGFDFYILNIARSGTARLRDLFLGFRYHTARLIGLSLLLLILKTVCLLPVGWLLAEFLAGGIRLHFFGLSVTTGPMFALVTIVCLLLSLLLFLGIYLPYCQALFIFIDHQDLRAVRCLSESRKMMKGNKIRFLLLELSFIGYGLLVLLSMGIGLFCVRPYIVMTKARFYIELSGRSAPYGI